jgi:hypothetical protein
MHGFESSGLSQAVPASRYSWQECEKAHIWRAFRFGRRSPGYQFAVLGKSKPKNLRPVFRKFPFGGDGRRRLGSIGTAARRESEFAPFLGVARRAIGKFRPSTGSRRRELNFAHSQWYAAINKSARPPRQDGPSIVLREIEESVEGGALSFSELYSFYAKAIQFATGQVFGEMLINAKRRFGSWPRRIVRQADCLKPYRRFDPTLSATSQLVADTPAKSIASACAWFSCVAPESSTSKCISRSN